MSVVEYDLDRVIADRLDRGDGDVFLARDRPLLTWRMALHFGARAFSTRSFSAVRRITSPSSKATSRTRPLFIAVMSVGQGIVDEDMAISLGRAATKLKPKTESDLTRSGRRVILTSADRWQVHHTLSRTQ